MGVYDGGRLIAASYLDVGRNAVSSLYAMFHPDHGGLSLGLATMLLEMGYAHAAPLAFADYGKVPVNGFVARLGAGVRF